MSRLLSPLSYGALGAMVRVLRAGVILGNQPGYGGRES